MNYSQRLRLRMFFGAILTTAFIIGLTLYKIQIENGASFASKADKQYGRPTNAVLDRGTIYFSSKDDTHVAAATVASGFLVYMNPTQIANGEQTYQALSEYLNIDHDDFLKRASKSGDMYEELAHHISDTVAASVAALGLKGIIVTKEAWRLYPGGVLAAHTLGLIGMNNDNAVEGRYGLERYYENVLSRHNVGNSTNVFAQLFSGLAGNGAAGDAGDIVTSIEPTTEKYLEKILSDASSSWHPDEIGGIIMDPNSGEILAMSSLPTYDPNNLTNVKNASVFSDPLVEHVYEMGSIVKPLTMAVALDSGAEKPNSTYDDMGTLTLSGKKISNFDGVARGVIPMQEILSQSLNVGAATIALKVGKDEFAKYFFNFGLGDKTEIDAPNEAGSLVNNLKTGRDVEIATAAYGQGIAFSPVNMARALSILANGGYVVRPKLVNEIDLTDGTTKTIKSVKNGPVLKKETIDDVTRMLVKVVDEKIAKAHPDIFFKNYAIAAKTGTAQIADHVNGGYYKDQYLHSFFGYFPASNPRFLVFLYQVYPKGAQYASETLTDPFANLAKFLINYYNVAPDR